MLRRENELRLLPENQDEIDTVLQSSDPYGYTAILDQIQRQVLQEFSYPPTSHNIEMYRSALSFYPNDSDIQNSVFYYKYNRSRDGPLSLFDAVSLESIPVVDLSVSNCGQLKTLKQVAQDLCRSPLQNFEDRPLVLIAGSIT